MLRRGKRSRSMATDKKDREKLLASWFRPWQLAIVASCLAALGVYYVDEMEHRGLSLELRGDTLVRLSHLRAEIEGHLNSDLQLFAGLAAQVSIDREVSAEEFSHLSQVLMAQSSIVRSVGFSEAYVVKYVYPLAGNEAAIGLDYLTNEVQREPVLRAVRNRETVLAGPVTLAQGGQALIGRLPVFGKNNNNGKSTDEFLGIVSVLIDMDRLFERVGLLASDPDLVIAIRGRDGMGVDGEVFWGREALFGENAVSLDISLPGGRWQMVAGGNGAAHTPVQQVYHRILGGAVILLVASAVFFSSRQLQQQKKMIAAETRSKEQVWHAATHDRLTGMANRYLFGEKLRQYIAQAERGKRRLAILFCDLDGFKHINDSFGHQVGDKFLTTMAKRMSENIRESELIARLGGDEFAIVSGDVSDIEEAANLAQRVIKVFTKPMELAHSTQRVGVSIGIAIYPEDGNTVDELLHNADLAMYKAKGDESSCYAFFEESMNQEVLESKQLVDDLQSGIEKSEFDLVYQPVVDIQSGSVIGVEALARWHNPSRGQVPPDTFIPVAEKSGLILPFGDWVMKQACDEVGRLLLDPARPIELSINLSPIQLYRGDPVKLARFALSYCQIPPDRLDMEITENTMLEDMSKATEIVKALRQIGVSVTVDDFGTGYSSLSHLRHLQVTRIKLDMSFIGGIGKDEHSEAIIRAILFLSNLLEIRVTAEGVETAEQLDFLRHHGCNEIQGHYFSRPLLGHDLFEYLDEFALPRPVSF